MTAPAIVAWAAHLGCIHLSGSHLVLMSSAWAVGIFTLAAVAEFVADQLPATPARTTALPLAVRMAMGSLTGGCLGCAGSVSLWRGALVDRRNRRSVRRLSRSRWTGSGASRSEYRHRHS